MSATAIAIASVPAAAAPAAQAASTSKEEAIGIGAGGVVGALAGGPVGFIVGAAIGARLGDTLDARNDEIETLSTSLGRSAARVAELETDVAAVGRQLAELEDRSMPELAALLEAGIAMDLLFRTDEHVLAEETGQRLADLGTKLAALPAVRIRLDGFADERGEASYNQALSDRRVRHVQELLAAAGVAPSRIDPVAHGESKAIDETPDSYALERRVSVRLYIADPKRVASNAD